LAEVISSISSSPSASPSLSLSAENSNLGVDFVSEINDILPDNPSEDQGDDVKGGKSTGKKVKNDDAARRYKKKVAKLKAATPPKKVLINDIRLSIRSQLMELSVKKKRAKRKGAKGFMAYNEVIADIRILKKLASSLIYRTYEDLKIVWLKVVHNIV